MAEHRIVVPGVVGSSPITHPRQSRGSGLPRSPISFILGRRQVVRQGTLTPSPAGSNPAVPANHFSRKVFQIFDPIAQPAEQLPFKQWVRGSNPRRVTNSSQVYACGEFFSAKICIFRRDSSGIFDCADCRRTFNGYRTFVCAGERGKNDFAGTVRLQYSVCSLLRTVGKLFRRVGLHSGSCPDPADFPCKSKGTCTATETGQNHLGFVFGCIYFGNGMDLFQLARCDYLHLRAVVCHHDQSGKSRANAFGDDFEHESLDRIRYCGRCVRQHPDSWIHTGVPVACQIPSGSKVMRFGRIKQKRERAVGICQPLFVCMYRGKEP